MTKNYFWYRILFVFLVLLFRISLDKFYIEYQPMLEIKWKFLYNIRSDFEVVLSYLFLLIISYTIPIYTNKPSKFILFILFLFSYISASSYIIFNNQIDFSPFVVLSLFFFIMSLLLRIDTSTNTNITLKKTLVRKKYIILGVVLIVSLLTFIQIKTFGFTLNPPNLLNVYEVREAYKNSMGRFSGYATTWTANVFAVFLFAYGVINKKIIFIMIAFILDLYIYSITGMKSTLFSLAFVTLTLVGYKLLKEYISIFFISFFLFANSAILLFLHYDMVKTIGILFTRRLFMVTAQIFFFFTDYVKTHSYDYFAQNLPFSLFMTSHYEKKIPYLIGNEYYGIPELAANSNIFGDFYFNLGAFGLFILLILFYIILKFIDNIALGKNNYITFSLFVMPSFAMTNSAFFTSLLTHGFLIAIFVLYFYKDKEYKLHNFKQ